MLRPLWSVLVVASWSMLLSACVDSDPPAPGLDLKGRCNGVLCVASDACHTPGECDPSTGQCVPVAKADGVSCDDGDRCTSSDTCAAGKCVGGAPIACVADSCHVGTCDSVTGQCKLASKADGAACDDGNACTKADHCQAGTCTSGNAVTCAAQDACHVAGTCDPGTGACTNPPVADATPCDDADACTQTSQCTAGVCVGAGAVVCAAIDQCHGAGTCSQSSGCSTPTLPDQTPCDNGSPNVPDVCIAGVCTALPATCRQALLAGGASVPDGVYTLYGSSGPFQAYCDMTTDGGGWTALFIGTNGQTNVFDHFDASAYLGTFSDPSKSKYLQRAPAELGNSAAELAVSCGTAKVKFAVTEPVRNWLFNGTQSDWQPLTPTVLAGNVVNVPNTLYTGNGANTGFMFAKNQSGASNTFASSYGQGTAFDYCNGALNTTSVVRVLYRELATPAVRNAPAPARVSCMAIRDAGEAAGDGLYWIKPEATSYLAYCDMTSAGGGWTATIAGRNGSPNVMGHLDTGAYQAQCTDPATRCLRRAPAAIGDAQSEVAVACGASMVRFPMTEQVRAWLDGGQQQDWIPVTPTVVTGSVANLPNTLYTGVGPGNLSFILAKNQSSGSATFASSYSNTGAFDYCAGTFDQASFLRVYYREPAATQPVNTAATAGTSCRALRDAGSTTSGVYHLTDGAAATYLAYCDMVTDGGGWTATYAGRNGSVNVFDHFDVGYQGICTDPATRCLRRSPASIGDSATDIAVSCGSAMVRFPLTEQVRRWMGSGQQQNWLPLTPTVLTGTVLNVPNTLFTGTSAGQQSFIFAKNQSSQQATFASSYTNDNSFDYCSGQPDQASAVRFYYREAAPTPVLNTAATAGATCRALQRAGANTSGIYHLLDGASATVLAYCDMTSDGGGWTTLFAGRNGSVNTFDHFDVSAYQNICTDPATRCVRRALPVMGDSAADVLVSCGNAQVRFARTEQMSKWLAGGTQQDWIGVTPTVVAGAITNIPNTLFTGTGGAGQPSFIVAKDQVSQGGTFASTYANSNAFDYCNGAPDQASRVRMSIREVDSDAPRNTQAQAKPSCLALLGSGFTQTGLYWLSETAGAPYTAFCDMTSAGGGWTALFAGRNGSPNVFARFDIGQSEVCTNPATRCLRRAPASASSSSELATSCGAAMVRFPMTASALAYLTFGTQANWIPLTPTVVSGSIPLIPNGMYTGAGGNQGFIFTKDQTGASTFSSSYGGGKAFDYCASAPDAASMVRVFYR